MNKFVFGFLLAFFCCSSFNVADGACPTIVSRSTWGASTPKRVVRLKTPVPFVVIHHTVSPEICETKAKCQEAMRSMQNFHKNTRKWLDIGYNFCVGGDGQIYEGRGWSTQGTHAPNYNSRSIGICFIGDYSSSNPKDNMVQEVKALIECGVDKGFISPTYKLVGHRQVKSTECPGNNLYNIIKQWSHYTAQV